MNALQHGLKMKRYKTILLGRYRLECLVRWPFEMRQFLRSVMTDYIILCAVDASQDPGSPSSTSAPAVATRRVSQCFSKRR